jgi:hypothetical protein
MAPSYLADAFGLLGGFASFLLHRSKCVLEMYMTVRHSPKRPPPGGATSKKPALKARLIDTSVEGFIILGHCRQDPTATVYDATAVAYRGLKSLRKHTTDAPAVQPHPPEGTSRFR